jgi:flagellin-like protein
MFETINNPDEERGQVGIGTLIVFIALVLVAAIAAGVLINTAGFLQNQAESTGQESSDQVTNGVNVVGATGEVDSGNVVNANLTVSLSPGADPVDLSDANVTYVGTSANNTVIKSSSGADIGIYTQRVDGSGTTLSNSSDRAKINIDLSVVDSDLGPGEEAEIIITTSDGAQTTEVLNVPDPIGGKSAVTL